MEKKICSVEGCEKTVYRKGMCWEHYFRSDSEVKCTVEWCSRSVYAKGLCSTHYHHVRKHGCVLKTRFTPNEYVIKDGYAEVILCDPYGIEKARGLLDIEDIELVKPYKWCLNKAGYVYNSYSKKECMHNVVMGAKMIDHVSGEKRDNRRCNLRAATASENSRNKGPSTNNKTGVRGVYKLPDGRYKASLQPKSGFVRIGVFDTLEEAALEYNIVAKKHYGEFAYQNEL